MSSSKTVALLAAIIIVSCIIGYIAYSNYQEDVRKFYPFTQRQKSLTEPQVNAIEPSNKDANQSGAKQDQQSHSQKEHSPGSRVGSCPACGEEPVEAQTGSKTGQDPKKPEQASHKPGRFTASLQA